MRKKLLLLMVLCFTALQGTLAQTAINLSSITGNIEITSTGYAMGGVAMEAALNPAGYELTGLTSAYSFKVSPNVTTTLYLNGITMSSGTSVYTLMDVSRSNTTIVLRDGTTNILYNNSNGGWFIGGGGCLVKNGSTGELIITCEHADEPGHECDATCGTLTAESTQMHVAVIGNSFQSFAPANPDDCIFSNLYVKGGNITATAALAAGHMPGIGAACNWADSGSKAQNMNFSGGNITAHAGNACAGIGTGAHGIPVYGLHISGTANITAYGGPYAPGIGSGGADPMGYTPAYLATADYSLYDFTITGGKAKVTAYGDNTIIGIIMPGIGCGDPVVDLSGSIPGYTGTDIRYGSIPHSVEGVSAHPEVGWQGYVKYGSTATQFAYSDTLPKTPFATSEIIGTFLDSMARIENKPVFYTQVYFGPYKVHNALDTLVEIGSNDYCYPAGGEALTESLLNAAINISGHDEFGAVLASTDFSVANGRMIQAQLDSLNKAIYDGVTGGYPITYTYIYNAPSDGLPDTLSVTSTIVVIDVNEAIGIKKVITKPFKVNHAQPITLDIDANLINSLNNFSWDFGDGASVSGPGTAPVVMWNTTGVKKCSVNASMKTTDPSTGNVTSSCELHADFRIVVLPESVVYMASPGQPDKAGVNDDEKSDDELYNEGREWENPFNLKDALHQASQGDVILVSEGTYTPSKGTSFVVDCDSVTIIGGAQGWETSASEVVTSKPENTIINGNGSSAVVVQLGAAVGACGITTATRIEGFVIQGGTAIAGENGSDGNGGGIYFKNGTSATIAHCIIKGNSASENGGGIYTTKYAGCGTCSDPVLYNVEISGNRAKQGAGMYNELSSPMLTNVTIGGNAASVSGAGVYNNATDSAKFRNTIVYGNVTGGVALEDEFVNNGGTPRISYSLISGSKGSSEWNTALGVDAGHNVDKNPIYRRSGYTEGGALREGNYRIVPGPAYNAGYNSYVYNIPLDLDGQDRIYSDIVDMGAYEYHEGDEKRLQHEVIINTYDYVTTVPPMGIHYADAHMDYTVTFYPKEGYSLQYMTVTTGSDLQDNKGGQIVTKNPDGSVTVIFQEVSEPLDIKIGGVAPTANEAIESMTAMWTSGGNLYVQVSKPQMLNIYTSGGVLYRTQQVGSGETVIPMEQGLYIVTLANGTKQKIVIK